MKPRRLIEIVIVGLVVALGTAMNVKASVGFNGLKPGTMDSMTHPAGISHRTQRPDPLTELASRPLGRER
jgi:hypothetical protein